MFKHNFKYSLRILFKNKALIFWTFAFPIILGTFFNLAFSNVQSSEKLTIIDIAVIDNEEFNNNEIFKNSFKELSDKNNEDRLFNTTYTNEEGAKELLNDKKIIGYMNLIDGEPKLTLMTNGIDQTIFKYVTEEISQTGNIIKNLSETKIKEEISNGNYNIDYEKIYNEVMMIASKDEVKITDISNNNLSYMMIEFYTLIAMTCLYGGLLGFAAINQNLANMTSQGKRVSVAPTSKGKVILSSVLAGYIIQLIGLAILFIYTILVLKVDYGDNVFLMILLAMAGSLAGLSIGVAVATLLKANDNTKTGIIVSVTMLGCFLSGMMGVSMKYIIDTNMPIINKINPAGMITDGFYALYYYDTLDRYIFDLISLLIFAFILIMISFISLRRQKYDSI